MIINLSFFITERSIPNFIIITKKKISLLKFDNNNYNKLSTITTLRF